MNSQYINQQGTLILGLLKASQIQVRERRDLSEDDLQPSLTEVTYNHLKLNHLN